MRSAVWTMILVWACATGALADDWPQWMGPGRDNRWRESGTLESFKKQQPRQVWSVEVAGGYAGPAVAAGRVFVTDYVTNENVKVGNFRRRRLSGTERVLCLDAATGQLQWKHEYPVEYTLSYPAGPRCTPVVDHGLVYTLGAEGHLHCLNVQDGTVRWSKDFKTEYKTKSALWGYASHPLVDGDRLLCVVGGAGSHIVAFDKNDGREIWRAQTASEQGYSPPTIMEFGGQRQLILLCPDAVTAIDPEDGDEFWSVPYQATNGSIIMSPVRWQNHLYAGGYSNKNLLLRVTPDADPEILWQDERNKGISPVNVQPIVVEGVMYGVDQSGLLMAVELPGGRRLWQTSQPISDEPVGTGTAFIVKQGDRYWLFNDNGELIIARLSPDGYQEIDRTKIIAPTNVAFGRDVVWCMPAFANQRLFVRNDAECICVDLSR